MKKVALYIPSLNGGGAERVMLTLANGLAERGLKVNLVLNKVEGPYLKDASSKVNIVNLNTSRVIHGIVPLAKYLNKEKPDVILSAMNYVNIATIIAQLISRSKTRVVLSEHGNLTESKKNLSRIKGVVITSLMRWAYKKPHAIVTVSEGIADALVNELNIKRNKITTVYNPICSEHIIKCSQKPPSHPWLKDRSIPLVISVGRLTEAKDFGTLIRAFKKVREQKYCNLIILGEGNLRAQIEELINNLSLTNCVQLPGFVDNPYAWMSQADLFVLSSVQEGLPTALIEAMACGTQVISTDCPSGPYEILEGGKWGELVPSSDSNLLAEAIIKSLNSPTQKDVKTRAAFFSVDNAVDQYLKIFSYE